MVHRDHKILRELRLGRCDSRRQGFPSLMRASSAVLFPRRMPALTRLSCPAALYAILGERCDECGNCYHVCFAGAVTGQGRFERLGGSHGKRTRRAQRNRSRPSERITRLERPKTSRTCPLTATSSAFMSRTLGAANRYLVVLGGPRRTRRHRALPRRHPRRCSPTTRCPWLLWLKPSGKIHPR